MSMWVPVIECFAAFGLAIGVGVHAVIETIRESGQHVTHD